jgi:hypothetical protein
MTWLDRIGRGSGGRAASAAAVLALLTLGCGQAPMPSASAPKEHEHHAPHGGTLVELGEEFAHLELVFDASEGRLTGYVLDGEAEQFLRIPQNEIVLRVSVGGNTPEETVTLAAVASPLTGETVGDTSEFVGTSAALRGASRFKGKVTILEVLGTRFSDVPFEFPATGS